MNPFADYIFGDYSFAFPRGGNRFDGPIFDYSEEDANSRSSTPQGDKLLDAGFAADTEIIHISTLELESLPVDEWRLLQRLIREPVDYMNTLLEFSQAQTFVRGGIDMRIIHSVPCITSMGNVTYG